MKYISQKINKNNNNHPTLYLDEPKVKPRLFIIFRILVLANETSGCVTSELARPSDYGAAPHFIHCAQRVITQR